MIVYRLAVCGQTVFLKLRKEKKTKERQQKTWKDFLPQNL